MSKKTKKILAGLSNIYFAPYDRSANTFGTPVRILYAKKIENKLNFELDDEWADNMAIEPGYDFVGGEGTLSVLTLTSDEQAILFGNKAVKGGIVVNSGDVSPEGAFLFERRKKKSTHRRLYVVYNCVCSPTSISAETIEKGKGAASVDEINYSVGELSNGDIYHFIDTDDPTVDQTSITKWFQEVQFPKEVSSLVKSKEALKNKTKKSNKMSKVNCDAVKNKEKDNVIKETV